MEPKIAVIGAGLAGSEAAWQIAQKGFKVKLYEMRPNKLTPAHKTSSFAELVCSNSFRSNSLQNAAGLLKQELRILDSLIMHCADSTAVPAGSALAVDRDKFSEMVTEKILTHPNIEIEIKEITEVPIDDLITIVATGPLTSNILAENLKKLTGSEYLYFYDAAAPIVFKESLNLNKVFWASRYDKEGAHYLNCPMDKQEYLEFYNELLLGERYGLKDFEKETYFEGCMPIEVLAKRGPETLVYGPLKPVGLTDKRTGKKPYAVVQLRQDNKEGTLFNMVGFQTGLKWNEQKRIFRKIPGLEEAEFARFGFIHRNTFICSPKILHPTMQTKENKKLFSAGQITGVEGYIESTASGLVAGLNAARVLMNLEPFIFPKETIIGALCAYITKADPKYFQPMKSNFGLLPEINYAKRDKIGKKRKLAQRSLTEIINLKSQL
ncbi:MAG TPA: methylenetetrahydrofolate--tRNA-(uracil(54)-C(5))-methyltransferase (FADH(2)-oxidizing) TrmFO [Thermoanaerobacterales bacterium]|nr:methylenetetrahydrofolate--tRNA-(uracil(54)-C(5))-methyltransferase (FADH(2)-oxidizing) TrmFO [Thermoanaerobacterales bacterium]